MLVDGIAHCDYAMTIHGICDMEEHPPQAQSAPPSSQKEIILSGFTKSADPPWFPV